MQDSILPLVGFAFVTSITPGPNNTTLLQSGAHYGLRATLPHIVGISSGIFLLVICVGLGVGELLLGQPPLYVALRGVCALYMVFLVWRVATAGEIGKVDNVQDAPMSYLQAAVFQWINPKVWVIALGSIAAYDEPSRHVLGSAVFIAGICTVVNAPCLFIWASFGLWLRDVLSTPRRTLAFNWFMAALLAVSVIPLFQELAAHRASA